MLFRSNGWAIALVGGAGEVRPPDSEWGEALRAASVCPRDVPGTAAPKNQRPEGRGPKTPQRKIGQKTVGYSLGGGRGRSSSAGLGMAPDLAGGLRVPKIGHGHSRAQKSAPEGRGPKTPQRKNGQKTGGL